MDGDGFLRMKVREPSEAVPKRWVVLRRVDKMLMRALESCDRKVALVDPAHKPHHRCLVTAISVHGDDERQLALTVGKKEVVVDIERLDYRTLGDFRHHSSPSLQQSAT